MVLRAVESGQEDILYDHIVIFCEDKDAILDHLNLIQKENTLKHF